jgi:hypothetical protein
MTTNAPLSDEDMEELRQWREVFGHLGAPDIAGNAINEKDAALRARIDELHDQRHEEARKADESRAEVLRLEKQRDDLHLALDAYGVAAGDTLAGRVLVLVARLEQQRDDLQAAAKKVVDLALHPDEPSSAWDALQELRDALRETTEPKKELDK